MGSGGSYSFSSKIMFSGCVSHCTCLHTRVSSVDTLPLGHIGRRDTLCCGSPDPPLCGRPGVVFRFPLKAVLCYAQLFYFFMNSFLMKWSLVPKHIKCSWEVTDLQGFEMCRNCCRGWAQPFWLTSLVKACGVIQSCSRTICSACIYWTLGGRGVSCPRPCVLLYFN